MDVDKVLSENGLPSKADFELELGVVSFEDDDDVVMELTKLLREKIAKYISVIEDVLQPDSSLISMQESSVFSEKERDSLFSLFKKIVLLQRTFILVNLDGSLDDRLAYLKQLFAGWKECKAQLRPFVQKVLLAWSDGQSLDEVKQNYFG